MGAKETVLQFISLPGQETPIATLFLKNEHYTYFYRGRLTCITALDGQDVANNGRIARNMYSLVGGTNGDKIEISV